jgi:hypothetical protein
MKYSLVPSLRFGSLLTYTAHEGGELGIKSRKLRDRIKNCNPQLVEKVCKILLQHLHDRGELLEIFERPNLTLVPVPGSAPLPPHYTAAKDALWSSFHYCKALKEAGIECSIEPCLQRTRRVKKSAFAPPGERLNPKEHYESMSITSPSILTGKNIVLVDDFITRGSTILGAASRIAEAFPNSTILGFAMVRTVYPMLLKSLVDPCVGTITHENGRLNREP